MDHRGGDKAVGMAYRSRIECSASGSWSRRGLCSGRQGGSTGRGPPVDAHHMMRGCEEDRYSSSRNPTELKTQ